MDELRVLNEFYYQQEVINLTKKRKGSKLVEIKLQLLLKKKPELYETYLKVVQQERLSQEEVSEQHSVDFNNSE